MSFVDEMPHLKSHQWTRIFEAVQASFAPPSLEVYLERAGDPPVKPNVKLRLKDHLQPTDWLIPVLFVALLAVSLSHMLTFAGELAFSVYKQAPDGFLGWWFDLNTFVVLHQAAFFAFSELGVLFFYTRHCLISPRRLSASLLSALACALIAIYANVYAMVSGGDVLVGGFIGFLVPLLTMLLGERLAEVVRAALIERRAALQQYEVDLARYRERLDELRLRYQADVDRHTKAASDPIHLLRSSDTMRLVAQKVVDTYKNTSQGRAHEWSLSEELALARREITRYLQFYQSAQEVIDAASSPEPTPPPLPDKRSELPEDKAERLRFLLLHNPEYQTMTGAALAKQLVDEGYFERLTPQYVNRVRKTLSNT